MLFLTISFSWSKKIPLVNTSEENAWLHHELGRCQLELGNYSSAMQHGRTSLSAAVDAKDQMWELNAYMLIAQCQGKRFCLFVCCKEFVVVVVVVVVVCDF